jgi:hypothetical protein
VHGRCTQGFASPRNPISRLAKGKITEKSTVGKRLPRGVRRVVDSSGRVVEGPGGATVLKRAGCIRVVSEPEDLVCILQAREEKEESTLILTTCVRVVSEWESLCFLKQRQKKHNAAQERKAVT